MFVGIPPWTLLGNSTDFFRDCPQDSSWNQLHDFFFLIRLKILPGIAACISAGIAAKIPLGITPKISTRIQPRYLPGFSRYFRRNWFLQRFVRVYFQYLKKIFQNFVQDTSGMPPKKKVFIFVQRFLPTFQTMVRDNKFTDNFPELLLENPLEQSYSKHIWQNSQNFFFIKFIS